MVVTYFQNSMFKLLNIKTFRLKPLHFIRTNNYRVNTGTQYTVYGSRFPHAGVPIYYTRVRRWRNGIVYGMRSYTRPEGIPYIYRFVRVALWRVFEPKGFCHKT